MKCIDEQLLQKYIDRECTSEESKEIYTHLSTCISCSEKYNQVKNDSSTVKEALGFLDLRKVEVPTFMYTKVHSKRKSVKYLIYSLSAACIILFILIFVDKKNNLNKNEIAFVQTVTGEINANKPFSEQEFVVRVIDSKGNNKEYFIE